MDVIDDLTTRAADLFIWAKIVTDDIGLGDPKSRLHIVTKQSFEFGDMGQLYTFILKTNFPSPIPDEPRWFQILTDASS